MILESVGQAPTAGGQEMERCAVQHVPVVPPVGAEPSLDPHHQVVAHNAVNALAHLGALHIAVVVVETLDQDAAQGGGELQSGIVHRSAVEPVDQLAHGPVKQVVLAVHTGKKIGLTEFAGAANSGMVEGGQLDALIELAIEPGAQIEVDDGRVVAIPACGEDVAIVLQNTGPRTEEDVLGSCLEVFAGTDLHPTEPPAVPGLEARDVRIVTAEDPRPEGGTIGIIIDQP